MTEGADRETVTMAWYEFKICSVVSLSTVSMLTSCCWTTCTLIWDIHISDSKAKILVHTSGPPVDEYLRCEWYSYVFFLSLCHQKDSENFTVLSPVGFLALPISWIFLISMTEIESGRFFR